MAINCPHCGASITESPELAAQNVACPRCGGKFVHPPPQAPSSESDDIFEPRKKDDARSNSTDHTQSHNTDFWQNLSSRLANKSDHGLPAWALLTVVISFGVLGLLTLGGALLFLLTLSVANGALQEAAAGAIFSALFIAGYIVARSIEKIVYALTRW